MKKQFLFLAAFIIGFNCYSQINFETGYFINNSGQKTECLIKNVDWKNNPTQFEYKLSADSDIKKATIQTVKEFGIYNYSKYIRDSVDIDRSSDDIEHLSDERNPVFYPEQLFLKVLVEGEADLFLYEDHNLRRYFYRTGNSDIQQLVIKRYMVQHKIGENNQFRQQLFNDLKCADISEYELERIHYNKNELCRLFVKYNECTNSAFTNFSEKQKKDFFNLTIRPGLSISNLTINNETALTTRNIHFDDEMEFRLGFEAEFILPFNKNKWTVIIEPTYHIYATEKEMATGIIEVNYTSIELPVGIRYYFYLSDNSKIFINGSFVLIDLVDKNSMIKMDYGADLFLRTRNNVAAGLGYKFKDKYSMEFRYQTYREILGNYVYWRSSYYSYSVALGYTF